MLRFLRGRAGRCVHEPKLGVIAQSGNLNERASVVVGVHAAHVPRERRRVFGDVHGSSDKRARDRASTNSTAGPGAAAAPTAPSAGSSGASPAARSKAAAATSSRSDIGAAATGAH